MRIKVLKNENDIKEGYLEVVKFANNKALRDKIREIGNNALDGSINESDRSVHINEELYKKIQNIKQKNGAKMFTVERREGEPILQPLPVVRNLDNYFDEPPKPAPIFPLKKFEQDDREVMTPREEAFQAENKEVDISFEEAQNEINSTLDFEIENYKVFD